MKEESKSVEMTHYEINHYETDNIEELRKYIDYLKTHIKVLEHRQSMALDELDHLRERFGLYECKDIDEIEETLRK